MGTVTKVMFGLIILVGGGGVFMSLSMIPEKVESLQKAKKMAEQNAQAYMSQVDGLKSDLSVKDDNLGKTTKERDDYKGKYDTAMKGQQGTQKLIDDANQAKTLAETKYDDLKAKYDADQPKLNQLGQIQSKLSKANNEVNNLKDELKKLKAKKKTTKPKPNKPVKITKSTVKNVDPKYGFITIPLSDKDTKPGDVFRVTRGGKFVGTIVVTNVRGSNSYCKVDKTQTTGIDKNPVTGDIKAGDDVELKK